MNGIGLVAVINNAIEDTDARPFFKGVSPLTELASVVPHLAGAHGALTELELACFSLADNRQAAVARAALDALLQQLIADLAQAVLGSIENQHFSIGRSADGQFAPIRR